MKKVRFGIIGAGGIAFRRTIPAMLRADNIEVAAVMDVIGADTVAAEFGIPAAFSGVTELLETPGLDAVYIASPAHCHLEQIRAAAAARKHILCEKPLTLSCADTRAAAAACRETGVFLQEGYMMKFHGAHRKMRDLINRGAIGRTVSMRAQLSCWYPPIPGAWRQDPATGGGGSLIDMGTHLLDLLEFLAGPATRVAALVSNLVQDYPSEDAATLLLEFESGAHATVDTFFCIPDTAVRTRLEVYGSKGSLLAEGTIGQGAEGALEGLLDAGHAGYDAQQDRDGAGGLAPIAYEAVNPYTEECAEFARAITAGREPATNGPDNAVRLAHITECAYRAAAEGRFVEI